MSPSLVSVSKPLFLSLPICLSGCLSRCLCLYPCLVTGYSLHFAGDNLHQAAAMEQRMKSFEQKLVSERTFSNAQLLKLQQSSDQLQGAIQSQIGQVKFHDHFVCLFALCLQASGSGSALLCLNLFLCSCPCP